MKPWLAILVALAIFGAGMASGAFVSQLTRARAVRRDGVRAVTPANPWMGQRLEYLRRLSERLDLSPAQHEAIDRLIAESQRNLKELWDPVAPKAREEITRLRRKIEEELTPAQREHFDRLMRDKQAAHPKPNRQSAP